MFELLTHCRLCGDANFETILDFRHMPLADALLSPEGLTCQEPRYPLTVVLCASCKLMQLRETVSPVELYCQDYPYYSSVSPALLRHSRENVEDLIRHRGLGPGSLVIELASNDGYLLQHYVREGIPVLGIDPAAGPAGAACRRDIPTLSTFFTEELAHGLVDSGRRADVIHANNVLAHVPDLNGFVRGIRHLLKSDGVVVTEVPYVRELIARCEFDTIYHEHLCYFSLTALRMLFSQHGLYMSDVRPISMHGGSLRLYLSSEPSESKRVRLLLANEADAGLNQPEVYRSFAKRVQQLRGRLLEFLKGLRRQGASIAAYGAAAKGATLINFVGIGTDLIDFVVDRNQHKHGKFMPGKHIPIVAPERLLSEHPDYTLMLAWNFREEILEQEAEYCRRGGRFILPLPHPTIIGEDELGDSIQPKRGRSR